MKRWNAENPGSDDCGSPRVTILPGQSSNRLEFRSLISIGLRQFETSETPEAWNMKHPSLADPAYRAAISALTTLPPQQYT